jgi:hypothetical protein
MRQRFVGGGVNGNVWPMFVFPHPLDGISVDWILSV